MLCGSLALIRIARALAIITPPKRLARLFWSCVLGAKGLKVIP